MRDSLDPFAPMLPIRLVSEGLGTAILLLSIVGSGIMGEALAGGNVAIALLVNSIATGCALYCTITILGPVSGAHINPVVTLAFALRGEFPWAHVLPYMAVQIAGGFLGVWAAHLMFELPILQTASALHRTGYGVWTSEVIGTFGLLLVIFGGLRHRPDAVPVLVALYIVGAYWFTSSSTFANPAIAIPRGFTDTFTGMWRGHIGMYLLMQGLGLGLAALVVPRLFRG